LANDREELLALRRLAELEAKAGAPTPVQPESPLVSAEGLKRGAGLAAGSLIKGATSIPGLVLNAAGGANELLNQGLASMGLTERYQTPFVSATQRAEQNLTGMGFPQPETGLEKVTDIGFQMIGGGRAAPIEKMIPKIPPAAMSLKDVAQQSAKEVGYKIPPSAKGGGFASSILESIGGKAAIKQQLTLDNQKITNELAKRAASLNPADEISEATLRAARENLSEPYRQVSRVSQTAAQALEKLKQTKFESSAQWKYYNRSANPEALKMARALDKQVDIYEKVISREAQQAGAPELAKALREARVAIAKNYSVERALTEETGDVSAKAIGRLDKPLTGELSIIRRFANNFPQYAGEAAKTPAPDVSQAKAIASLLAGLLGGGAAGPAGFAAGAIPFVAPRVARNIVLSRALRPNIPPGALIAGEEAIRQ